MSASKPPAPGRSENVKRRIPSVLLKRRAPYLAAVVTVVAFAFLYLIVVGISPPG